MLVVHFCPKVCKWKPCDLDYILDHGNILIKFCGFNCFLAIDKLRTSVKVENCEIRVFYLFSIIHFKETEKFSQRIKI